MSLQATKWAWAQDLKEPDAGPKSTVHVARKLVLMALADKMDRNGYGFPGRELLAEMTGLHKSTVTDHLGFLERGGWLLERHRRHRENGSRTSDEYTLNLSRLQRPSEVEAKVADSTTLGRRQRKPRSSSANTKVGGDDPHNGKGDWEGDGELTTTTPNPTAAVAREAADAENPSGNDHDHHPPAAVEEEVSEDTSSPAAVDVHGVDDAESSSVAEQDADTSPDNSSGDGKGWDEGPTAAMKQRLGWR